MLPFIKGNPNDMASLRPFVRRLLVLEVEASFMGNPDAVDPEKRAFREDPTLTAFLESPEARLAYIKNCLIPFIEDTSPEDWELALAAGNSPPSFVPLFRADHLALSAMRMPVLHARVRVCGCVCARVRVYVYVRVFVCVRASVCARVRAYFPTSEEMGERGCRGRTSRASYRRGTGCTRERLPRRNANSKECRALLLNPPEKIVNATRRAVAQMANGGLQPHADYRTVEDDNVETEKFSSIVKLAHHLADGARVVK
eukprot:9467634-Pyramimonas_sp.AAC.1